MVKKKSCSSFNQVLGTLKNRKPQEGQNFKPLNLTLRCFSFLLSPKLVTQRMCCRHTMCFRNSVWTCANLLHNIPKILICERVPIWSYSCKTHLTTGIIKRLVKVEESTPPPKLREIRSKVIFTHIQWHNNLNSRRAAPRCYQRCSTRFSARGRIWNESGTSARLFAGL